jgi:hypothetical protein
MPERGEPATLHVLATVTSADVVTSPLGGGAGAVVQLEVAEGAGEVLGVVNLGDTLSLRTEDGRTLLLIVGRLSLSFDPAEAALVPLIRRAGGRTPIAVRERLLRQGDRVRVHAVVEGGSTVRDDLSPVRLEVTRFFASEVR